MKRVFISIPIAIELQQHIADFQAYFKSLPVRWLKPENLHITLVPPLEVSDEKLAEIIAQLKQIPRESPFPISFNNVSFGPDETQPHLIWARGEAPVEILQLKQNIEQAINYQPEHPHFTMHTTLARFPEHEFKKFPIQTLNETVHWKMLVNEFVIMQSIRQPGGSRYPILQIFSV